MASVVRARTEPMAKPKLISRLVLAQDGTVSGFVFDPQTPERRFTVDILLDGLVLKTTYADAFVQELSSQGQNSTCGFAASIDPELLRAATLLKRVSPISELLLVILSTLRLKTQIRPI